MHLYFSHFVWFANHSNISSTFIFNVSNNVINVNNDVINPNTWSDDDKIIEENRMSSNIKQTKLAEVIGKSIRAVARVINNFKKIGMVGSIENMALGNCRRR